MTALPSIARDVRPVAGVSCDVTTPMRGRAGRAAVRPAALLLLLALLLRAPLFGDPVIFSDEQFYLLVGDRMLHGALPYVDIWDRKPIGLFLIYAAIRLFGGRGIVQYQIVATLFAAATAFLIFRIGCLIANRRGGFSAGAAYLIWLMIFNGAGGQAPVFYNLFVAGAGLVLLGEAGTVPARASPRRLCRTGAKAMAMTGVAIQVKYTVLFEGLFFGLWLLRRARCAGTTRCHAVREGTLWGGIAILPTLAAFLVYAATGHGRAFCYANFVSIFFRQGDGPGILAGRLLLLLAGAAPLLLSVALGLRRGAFADEAGRFVQLWLLAASIGFLLFGGYHDHYFLPVLVPLCSACAPVFGDCRASAKVRAIALRPAARALVPGLVAAIFLVHRHYVEHGNRHQIEAVVRAIGPRLDHCLFVFGSEPILYHLTGACMVTPYAFRSHLDETRESAAIGVDPVGEMKRLLARKPGVIVVRQAKANTNRATLAVLASELARNYRLLLTVRIGRLPHYIFVRRAEHPLLPAGACVRPDPSRGTRLPQCARWSGKLRGPPV